MKNFFLLCCLFATPLLARAGEAKPEVTFYNETLRPQFHFTARKGWINDPNGLVFYKGEYHLFFQHIPIEGKGQFWGHAISTDLVHWEQISNAIAPDKLGAIWSGSAVIDWRNTAGLQTGNEKTLIALYTCAGGQTAESKGQPFTQNLAWSNDRGRTVTKYGQNPVLPQISPENRDPKVIWHEPSRKWIMIFFKTGNIFSLFSSPDLKNWTHLHDLTLPGGAECPDIFEMPVEGTWRQKKWIITSASGNYTIGNFDGARFTSESGPHRGDWGKNFYAVQTYSDIPRNDGRRIQIAWMAWAAYPNMPFNQQLSFPCELTLRSLPEGLRICRTPVKEIALLRGREYSCKNEILNPGENPLAQLSGDLFEIRAEIDLSQATDIGFKLRGEPIHYSLTDRKLTCLGQSAPLDPIANRVTFQILLDRTSIEIFANGGRLSMSSCFVPDPKNRSLEIYAKNGPCKLIGLKVYELKSAWPSL